MVAAHGLLADGAGVVLLGSQAAVPAEYFTTAGFHVTQASCLDALGADGLENVVAVVASWTDLQPDLEQCCEQIRAIAPSAALILLRGDNAALEDAVRAMRTPSDALLIIEPEGAGDAIIAAIERRALLRQLSALEAGPADSVDASTPLIGQSAAIQRVRRELTPLMDSAVSVLLAGESGTGKEVVARALHSGGSRASGPFVAVNCAAISPELMESQFFGHVKGAFTGASRSASGLFAAADGGTLFLDEISAMSPELQPKLLRVLQEKRVRPVGSKLEFGVDVRVIAATNVDLEAQVSRGAFRRDLYYRLNVVEIALPPLRQRRDDVLLLAYTFLRRAAATARKRVLGFTPAAARHLLKYPWPGNVRELQNCVKTAVAVARFDHVRDVDLPGRICDEREQENRLLSLEQVERSHIARVLQTVGGNKAQAARLLGITRKTLYRKVRNYALDGSLEAADFVTPNLDRDRSV